MREAWEHLLGFTRQLTVELFDVPVRTVVHGYDYAIPDGRGFLGGAGPLPGPWLAPSYAQKRIGSQTRAGLRVRSDLTRDLVDRYNAMLAVAGGRTRAGARRVRRTCGACCTPADHKDDWANELHPTACRLRGGGGPDPRRAGRVTGSRRNPSQGQVLTRRPSGETACTSGSWPLCVIDRLVAAL